MDDAALYDRYGHIIFAYARLHIFSREDAEDLTLDVFLKALEHDNLSALREEDRLAWLRRVAHNLLVDRYRHSTRHPLTPLNESLEILFEDESRMPEHIALQNEIYAQLHLAVATLSPFQQQLLRLRYGDNLRYAEIGVLLNKREETVRKLLSRTLAALRAIYHKLA
jgi:RNA polymerase sigma-70 factor (ECF subfamily)